MCRRRGHRVDVCGSNSNVLVRERMANDVDSDSGIAGNTNYHGKDGGWTQSAAAGTNNSDA